MRLLEGENPPLQNENLFLSSSYLKGTLHHYKMKIGFYIFFIIRLLEGNTSILQNDDWKWLERVFTCCLPKGNFPCYKMIFDFSPPAR